MCSSDLPICWNANVDGAEKHIDGQLPPTFAFQQMGEGWIQVRDIATQQQYALRLTEGKEQFYALPGVDQ